MDCGQIVDLKALSYYLQRIRKFLDSKKHMLLLPNISTELRDVFVKIVQEGVGFLQGDEFSAIVKLEGSKLGALIEAQKEFILTIDYKDGSYGPNVLAYIKEEVNPFKAPEPLRKPSEVQSTHVEPPADPLVTPVFKIRCLNATTKFVKDDSELIMKFPPMADAQAQFVMTIISQGIEGTEQTEVGYGYRSMYAPLWEAMRLLGLKYAYRLRCDDCIQQQYKQVIFEKVLKSKPAETEKMEVDNPVLNNSFDTVSSITSVPDSRASTPIPTTVEKTKGKEKKKVPKVMVQMRIFTERGKLTEEFMEQSLKRIVDFLFADTEANIMFTEMEFPQYYFLRHVEILSKRDDAYMFFNSKCQKLLQDVKYNVTSRHVLYKVQEVEGKRKESIKDIQFIKQSVVVDKSEPAIGKQAIKQQPKQEINSGTANSKPTKKDQEALTRYKQIINNLILSSGEAYITTTLYHIHDFLTDSRRSLTFQESTIEQANFLRHVHTWSRMEEVYTTFSEECRTLLSAIKLYAGNFELKYNAVESYAGKQVLFLDVTITKKLRNQGKTILNGNIVVKNEHGPRKTPIEELYRACNKILDKKPNVVKRARSLSGDRKGRVCEREAPGDRQRGPSTQRKTVKEKLIEGLAQPVQSDKAMKMMQSMGWKGGALGPRGEGIMEPIMPALDTRKRAGLGHELKKPEPRKSKPHDATTAPGPPHLVPLGMLQPASSTTVHLVRHHRVFVLDSVWRLTTSDNDAINFYYDTTPGKKHPQKMYNFIAEVCRTFNKRKVMLLALKVEAVLIDKILGELRRRPALAFNVEKLNDNSCIVHKVYKGTKFAPATKDPRIIAYIDLTGDDNTEKSEPIKKDNNVAKTNKEAVPISTNIGKIRVKTLDELTSYKEHFDTNGSNVENKTNIPEAVDTEMTVQPNTNLIETKNKDSTEKTNENIDNFTQALMNECKKTNEEDTDKNNNVTANINDTNKIININEHPTDRQNTDSTNTFLTNSHPTDCQNTDSTNTILTNSHPTDCQNTDSTNTILTNSHHTDCQNTDSTNTILTNSHPTDCQNTDSNNTILTNSHPTDCQNTDITNTILTNSHPTDCQNTDSTNTILTNSHHTDCQNTDSTNTILTNSHPTDCQNTDSNNTILTNSHPTDCQNTDITNTILTNSHSTDCQNTDITNTIHTNVQNMTDVKLENVKNENLKLESELDDDFEIFDDDSDCDVIDSEDEDRLLNPEAEPNPEKLDCGVKIENNEMSLSVDINDILNSLENINVSEEDKGYKDGSDSGISQTARGKRRSESPLDYAKTTKKAKLTKDFKRLCIVHKNYPQCSLDKEKAREIQLSIVNDIDYTREELPMLTCEGIQNGGLVYGCHDENSVAFMEDLIKKYSEMRILYEFDCDKKVTYKMAFRMNNFIEEDVSKILQRIELYNSGLNATKWRVIKREQYMDFIVIYVELDEVSFNYICDLNFILCAGNDCGKFTIIWD